MESVLEKLKRHCTSGPLDDDSFDTELVDRANDTIAKLVQLGVTKPDGPYCIDANTTWEEVLDKKSNPMLFHMCVGYICDVVKRDFDPPTNSTLMERLNQRIQESEYRITIETNKEDEQSETELHSNSSAPEDNSDVHCIRF